MLSQYVDRLVDIVHNADELPDEVEGAINDVLAHVDSPVAWYKAPFFKNGRFSKTATFATLANLLVLAAYVLSLFKGTVIGQWTVPEFDATAALAIMGIANGTYVANRLASAKENGGG